VGGHTDHCTTNPHLSRNIFLLTRISKVYLSGNALVVLDRADHVLQTIYIDEESDLEAVALDEATGKFAACSNKHIFIYRPYGQDEGSVKVRGGRGEGGVGGPMAHPIDADVRSGRCRAACPFRTQETR